jgi:hypothetical protein
VSAQVYEWEKISDNPMRWKRSLVQKKFRDETLDFYEESQKIYHSISNVWDCCEEFGRPVRYEVESYPEPMEPVDIPVNEDYPLDKRIRSPSPPPLSDEHDSSGIAEQNDLVNTLSCYYGFVPPPPIPHQQIPSIPPNERKKFLHIVGFIGDDDPIFTLPLGKIAIDFIRTISTKHRASEELWDLRRGNSRTVGNSKILGCIYPLSKSWFTLSRHGDWTNTDWFIVDSGSRSTTKWKILFTSAADALFFGRIEGIQDELDVVQKLLERGVEFHIVVLCNSVPRPLQDPPKLEIPYRLPGYVFTKRDYDAYLSQCAVILNGPGGRAALMRGGIIWRIAKQMTSFEVVLIGPSSHSLIHSPFFMKMREDH